MYAKNSVIDQSYGRQEVCDQNKFSEFRASWRALKLFIKNPLCRLVHVCFSLILVFMLRIWAGFCVYRVTDKARICVNTQLKLEKNQLFQNVCVLKINYESGLHKII